MKRLAAFLLAALTILPFAFGAGELSNRRAPGFSLPDLNLQQHDLADYRGKVVLVNIMKTTCPHCAAFSKILNAAEKKYSPDVKVLNIVHPPDNQQMVKQYLSDNNLESTVLFDCGQAAASYLKVTPQNPSFEVPHVFVIDQKGKIQEDYGYNPLAKGIFEGEGIYKIIEKYLPRPSVARAGAGSDR